MFRLIICLIFLTGCAVCPPDREYVDNGKYLGAGQCVEKEKSIPETPKPKERLYNQEIAWRVDVIGGSAEAQYNNMPMMVFLTENWDGDTFGKRMMNTTFCDPHVIQYLNEHFVSVKQTFTKENDKEYKIQALPAYVFVHVGENSSTMLGRTAGYMDSEQFINMLDKALELYNAELNK
jgi:thioredoxin-related protein